MPLFLKTLKSVVWFVVVFSSFFGLFWGICFFFPILEKYNCIENEYIVLYCLVLLNSVSF